MRVRIPLAALSLAAGLALAPVHADTTIEEKRTLEPGGTFLLDAAGGTVTVRGTTSSGARIVIHSRRDDLRDLYDFKFEESPGQVRVTIKRKSALDKLWHGDSMDIRVEIPKDTRVDVQTAGGSLDVEDVTRDVKLRTSGGSVEGERLGARVDAGTSGGSIKLSAIAGDIVANTSGGTIRIEGAGGKVDAETSGGGIETRFAAGNARGGKLETSGGGVRVYLDPAVDLTLDAATSGGTVTSALPITGPVNGDHDSVQGAIGKGGETLRIRSSGGSIRVEKI